jgi:hypothetical protein
MVKAGGVPLGRKEKEGNMKRIYIAGRLNDDAVGYLQNVSRMVKAALEIRKRGYSVFVPCLDLVMGIVDGNMSYEDYTANNKAWVEVSDAVYVIPGSDESRGTQEEIALALRLGIPVIRNIRDLER